MSDHELRADSLEAGHRRSTKKAKPEKAGKTAKVKGEKKVRPPKEAKSGAGIGKRLAGLATPLAAPLRVVKKGAGKVWAVWDRAYDDAMARPVHAVRVFGVVVAVVAVLAGLSWYQTDHYERLGAARAEAVKEGEGAVGRLLSYSFRTTDRQVEKTQDLVTGKFKDEYAQFINTKIVPAAKIKQVNVQTSVDRSAVVSSSLSEAVVLMYLDVDSEALLGFTGDTTTSAMRVTLEKEDGKWKVSELTPV
jgi:Mce-associated membrane protein